MKAMPRTTVCLFLTSLALNAAVSPPPPAAAPRPYPERLAWWADARFGMFVHWGPVSLKGAEISWSRANSNPKCPNNGPIPVEVYDNLYKEFNPVGFDAAAWVGVAKSAGAKYIVLTAKHPGATVSILLNRGDGTFAPEIQAGVGPLHAVLSDFDGDGDLDVATANHASNDEMLQRNFLYTASTRGRKLVVLLGSPRAVGIAVNTLNTQVRYTALRQRLKGILPLGKETR